MFTLLYLTTQASPISETVPATDSSNSLKIYSRQIRSGGIGLEWTFGSILVSILIVLGFCLGIGFCCWCLCAAGE